MATPARARETFVALRHAIAKIEGRLAERLDAPDCASGSTSGDIGLSLPPMMSARLRQPVLTTGVEAFDAALGGGMPLAGLVELHGEGVRDGGTTSGLALAFTQLLLEKRADPQAPLLWIATTEMTRESGRPYAPGLAARFGITAWNIILAEAAKPAQALWIAEEAANTGAFASILVEMRGAPSVLDLTATRRLHRRALLAGHPLFMLLHAGRQQPTAAPIRLCVAPVRSTQRRTLAGPLAGSIGPPAFAVTVAKSRTALAPSLFLLEWTENAFREHTTHTRPLVSLPASRTAAASSLRTVVAFPRPGDAGPAGAEPARKQHPARRGA